MQIEHFSKNYLASIIIILHLNIHSRFLFAQYQIKSTKEIKMRQIVMGSLH